MLNVINFVIALNSNKLMWVEPYCAKTTIRLWHELSIKNNIPHDFQELLSPGTSGKFLAYIHCNEIKAIGQFNDNFLKRVAHCPEQNWAASALLQELNNEENIGVDYHSMKHQFWLYCETLYML